MQFSTLQHWYESTPGKWLLQFEQEQADKWVSLIRGATVIQMGGLPDTFKMANHERANYYFLSGHKNDLSCPEVDVLAHCEELPFSPNTVDLVLLVHVLEYTEHPMLVLKEIFDVLAPHGKLLLFCFNPWSLWGAHKLFTKNQKFPWLGKFISPWRLHYWLMTLGYQNLKDKTLCYRSPFKKRKLTRVTAFFEALGQITIPTLGAVNVFLVEKRIYGTLKGREARWQKQSVISSGVVEPTTRNEHML